MKNLEVGDKALFVHEKGAFTSTIEKLGKNSAHIPKDKSGLKDSKKHFTFPLPVDSKESRAALMKKQVEFFGEKKPKKA